MLNMRVAMDSLPTGPTQSWFIVAAVGLCPVLVLVMADLIGWVLRRKWWEYLGGAPVRRVEAKRQPLRVDARQG